MIFARAYVANMIKVIALLSAALLMTACNPDETISGYADPSSDYHLTEMNGVAFTGRATISFPELGRVAGQAPCNRYFGEQTEFYPWFGLIGIGSTRMACPDMALEGEFFATLEAMTLAEVAGGTLILSNTEGAEMVFVAR